MASFCRVRLLVSLFQTFFSGYNCVINLKLFPMPAHVHTVVNHTLAAYRTQGGCKRPSGYLIEVFFLGGGEGGQNVLQLSVQLLSEERMAFRPSGANCKFSVEVRYLEINLLLPW